MSVIEIAPWMYIITDIMQLLSVMTLGLLVGALLAEDALLIPYWRTLSAQQFYALHPVYAPRLYRFFAPLTIAAPMLALLAAACTIGLALPGRWFVLASAVLAWSLVGIYFIYFKDANAAFANHAIAESELAAELGRWAGWHRRRCVFGVIAFIAAVLSLSRL